MLAAKLDNMSSIPGTLNRRRELNPASCPLTAEFVYTSVVGLSQINKCLHKIKCLWQDYDVAHGVGDKHTHGHSNMGSSFSASVVQKQGNI